MVPLRMQSKTILHVSTAMLAVFATTTQAQTVRWFPQPGQAPSARCCSGLIYDGATRSTLLFGGANGASILGDTWIWRGAWQQMFPTASPSPRQGLAMAFDEATGTIVLFGGSVSAPLTLGSSLGDTWTWDGANWTLQSPPVSPSPRTWATMAYVPATKSVVLFGGAFNNSGLVGTTLDDTWTWDGIAKTWTQQNPASHPSARAPNQLVYDKAAGNVVLFGGVSGPADLNDTWTWDGASWTQQNPAANPGLRNGPALAYDGGLNAVVLFGGAVGPCCSNNLNDTWGWGGRNWTQIYPANSLPHARNAANMEYDAMHRVVLMFGGDTNIAGDSNGVLGDTWLLSLVR